MRYGGRYIVVDGKPERVMPDKAKGADNALHNGYGDALAAKMPKDAPAKAPAPAPAKLEGDKN